MNWLNKHADAAVVLTAVLGSFFWMNSSISSLEKEISQIKTEVAIIKTVMLMYKILPAELAKTNEVK